MTVGHATGETPPRWVAKDQSAEACDFSLVRGGPLHRLLRRVGLARDNDLDALRLSVAFVAFVWLPTMVLAVAERLRGPRWDPIALDYAVHARLLVAVPLLFIGDQVLNVLTGHAVTHFVRGRLADDSLAVERAIASARRLRDALAPELVMVAIAAAFGQLLYWQYQGSTGLLDTPAGTSPHSAARMFYAFVALPLTQVLFMRWVWRWFIWSRLVWQFARLGNSLEPIHPDRHGGIGFFAEPAAAFAGGLCALSAVQAGAWLTRIYYDGAQARSFHMTFWVLLAGSLLFTHAPLLAWSGRLWKIRHKASREYGLFSLEYSRLFDRKWLRQRDEHHIKPLGSPDIQALADLGHSFETAESVDVVIYNRRSLRSVAVAVAVPMIPVLLTEIPLAELIHKLTSVALGGGGEH